MIPDWVWRDIEIGKKLLEDSINWARNYTQITKEEEEIILHCRKSFLFFDKQVYVKKSNPQFSVEQGGCGQVVRKITIPTLGNGLTDLITTSQIGIPANQTVAIGIINNALPTGKVVIYGMIAPVTIGAS